MKLLIVDDSAEMRRAICELTADLVDGVFECADGGEAFDLYEKHRPDWVLMDIEMKNTDGIRTTCQITGAFPKARIAVLTSYDDDDLRETEAAAGALEYIVKENLISVRRLLAR